MDNPLISVIVPIYMIDRYLGICIESIINQTYSNLEIILVDDGSKDRCSEICDLYASKDKRIRIIHKKNGGLVSARKAGLQHSNGEYISYVDGDDWISPGFIESLYTAAKINEAEMVCAGFTRDLFSKSASFTNSLSAGFYEGKKLEDLWRNMISTGSFYRPGINTYVWNKLFRREILLNCQTQVDDRISIGEDGAVTYPALFSCSRVVIIDNVDYHYRQREDSMLKQSARYVTEAQKLLYLFQYLHAWANTTPASFRIREQVDDYVLSIALMRSGGRLPHDNYSTFEKDYYGKRVVIFSAGTFGQQLVNRFRETKHCSIVAWVDDDYWEYRRCCLDVDPVESISELSFDYVLIATVDSTLASGIIKRLTDYGVSQGKILSISVLGKRSSILSRFLDVEALRIVESTTYGVSSHA